MPPARKVVEQSREIPVIGEYDVVVIGGGVAGVAAAVASAREGASTVLVENHCVLGGLATEGLIAIYLPICDGRGRKVMGGLAEELLLLCGKNAPYDLPDCWKPGANPQDRTAKRYMVRYSPHPYMLALEEFVLAGGVDVQYDSRLCAAVSDGGRLTAVIVENKTGRCAIAGRAFVDASGDADLCARAGQPTISQRCNPRSAWFVLSDRTGLHLVGHHVAFTDTPEGEELFTGDNHADVNRMLTSSRPMVMEKIRQFRAEKGFDEMYPALISTIPQFRVTRRLAGAFELDESHVHQWFDDAISLAGDWRTAGPVYSIPYRCIAATKFSNLLVAGRCVSSTRSGAEITRVIPVCVATGQAAGTAAAMACSLNQDIRTLDMAKLQKKLADQSIPLDKQLVRKSD